jgi:gliding motility-associated-like protein
MNGGKFSNMMKIRWGQVKNRWIFLFTFGSILLLAFNQRANASHAMAIDLTYKCLGGNQYEFTLSFYRDCKGIAAPFSPVLHINSPSCGVHSHINLTSTGPGIEVSSICNASIPNTSCNGGTLPGVQKYTYTGTYTLPFNCPDWVFSYSECCRNNLITNLTSKGNIYVEATLNNSIVSCNSSPSYTSIPVPYICNGQLYTYTHGVVDAEGDSLVYTLINPLQGRSQPIGFSSGYSVNNPILSSPALQFDQTTGEMKVTPNGSQVCVLAMQVNEYRDGVLIGTTMRDMQVIVNNCTNTIPYITNNGAMQNQTGGNQISSNVVEVCPGQTVSFDFAVTDDDGDALTLTSNIASAIPGATLTTSVTGSNATGNFSWPTSVADIGFHTFTVNVKDDACQVSGQQTYSFSVNVLPRTTVGPDRYYCPSGGPIQLVAKGGSLFQWTLLDGSAPVGLSCSNCSSPLASPSITSTYVISSNFNNNCGSKDTITVFVVSDFNLTVSSDTVTLCKLEEGVQIQADPGPDPVTSYQYQWNPVSTLSDAGIQNPIARPTSTTTYFCTVIAANGCSKKDSVTVRVRSLVTPNILPGDTVETCDSVQLNVVLTPYGEIFSEPFDHEIDSTNWSSIQGGILSDLCGTMHDESYYLNQPGLRALATKDVDVTRGGVINFYLKAGFCDQCTCDRPENSEQDENFYLDYSTDGGATWTLIQSFDADQYAAMNGFAYISITIPDDAETPNTRFRWNQLNHFPDKDVWILENISIKEGLSDYSYQWTPSTNLTNDTIANPVAFPTDTITYKVLITDKETGCTFTDSITIIFKNEFEVSIQPEVTRCPDDTSFVELNASTSSGKVYTYEWTPSTGLSNPNIANPTASPTTSTTYTVIITDPDNGCYRREETRVTVPPPFSVDITADTSICVTQSISLNSTVSPNDTYEYLWRPITGISNQTDPSPTARPATTTTYTLFVRHSNTGCIKADSVKLTVFPDFTLDVTGDATLCPFANEVAIEALASPGTDYAYEWSPGPGITDPTNPSQLVNPPSNTYYTVLCHDLDGCWKKDSAFVQIYNGTLDLRESADTLINEGDIASLYASGAIQYRWYNGTQLISDQSATSVSPQTTTTYLVYGNDACYLDSATVTVSVTPLEFFIPNLITPNGDGKNDNFKITNFGQRWDLEVYNRWGDVVYKKEKYIQEWEGQNLSDGVYYFHIRDTLTDEVYKGWVEIIR